MNLQELANLVLVRNHLAHLIDYNRAYVSKDKVRQFVELKNKFDKLFLSAVDELNLGGLPVETNVENKINYATNGAGLGAVTVIKSDEQGNVTEVNGTDTTKTTKSGVVVIAHEDEEVKARVAQAKEELKKTGKKLKKPTKIEKSAEEEA